MKSKYGNVNRESQLVIEDILVHIIGTYLHACTPSSISINPQVTTYLQNTPALHAYEEQTACR